MQQHDAPPVFQFESLYQKVFSLYWKQTSTERVKILYFGTDIPQIEGNVCAGRRLTADLLDTLASLRPAAVALDKRYLPDSCNDVPETTRALQDSVAHFPAPLIVGQAAQPTKTSDARSCECRGSNLLLAGPMVHPGLVRLNEDVLQVPLRWVIREKDERGSNYLQPKDTMGLAFATAVQVDPALARTMRDQFENDIVAHPYANLWGDGGPEQQNVRDFLCTNGTAAIRDRWQLHCASTTPLIDFEGKAVVIGSKDPDDLKLVLGENLFGYDINARYVAALLGGATLREWPLLLELGWALLLVFLPEAFAHFYEGKWSAMKYWQFCLSLLLALLTAIAGVISLLFGFLPPLALLATAGLSCISQGRDSLLTWAKSARSGHTRPELLKAEK